MSSSHFALLENQAIALMGRLHVILRRQNGRITDIEYMRISPAYCRHVLDMASQLPDEDLRQICAKLEALCFGADSLFTIGPQAGKVGAPASSSASSAAGRKEGASSGDASGKPADHGAQVDQTYIGRLR
jgi:hypothetical protein